METYISAKPTFRLKHILYKNQAKSIFFPLNEAKCQFYFSSRYAFAGAIEALGLRPNDKILVPSYNCGVEIDPILHFELVPIYYRVKKNLMVDFDDLLAKITNEVKAVLITHFLGFPQPVVRIKSICEENNLLLIEDCAHAFLSSYKEYPLGSFGDAAFFSLLKTLPLPNGGLLVLNKKDAYFSKPQKIPNKLSTFFYISELLNIRTRYDKLTINRHVFNVLNEGLYLACKFAKLVVAAFRKILRSNAPWMVRPDTYDFKKELLTWGWSKSSKNILKYLDFNKIKNKRRENFNYLLDYFLNKNEEMLIFRKLPSGVCPLFFPVIVKSDNYRQGLYKRLKSRGVITHPWWDRFHQDVPWHDFPDAVYLKKRLFGLPIHQDLEIRHLDQLISEFESAN